MFLKPRINDFMKYGFNGGWNALTKGFATSRVVSYGLNTTDTYKDVKQITSQLRTMFAHPDLMANFYHSAHSDRLNIFCSAEFALGLTIFYNPHDPTDPEQVSTSVPSFWRPEIMRTLQEIAKDLDLKTGEKNLLMLTILFQVKDKDGKDVPVYVKGKKIGDLAENICMIASADAVTTVAKSAASRIDNMGTMVIKSADSYLPPGTKPAEKPFLMTIREVDGSFTEVSIGVSICLDIAKEAFGDLDAIRPDLEVVPSAGRPDYASWKTRANYVYVVDGLHAHLTAGYKIGEAKERETIKDMASLFAVRTGLEYVSLVLSEAGVYETVVKTDPETKEKHIERVTANNRAVVSHAYANRTHTIGDSVMVEMESFEIKGQMNQAQAEQAIKELKHEAIMASKGVAEQSSIGEHTGENTVGEHPSEGITSDHIGQEHHGGRP